MQKTLFTTLIILLTSVFLPGQTPGDLLKSADELYQKAAYQEALSTLQKLLNGEVELSSRIEVSSYLLAGNIYLDAGQTEGAANFYAKALALGQSALGESDSLTIQAMNNSAECDYRAGNIKKSAARHDWVLKKRIEKYTEKHADVADSYNNLANCQYALGDLEAATDLHKKALGIRQKVFRHEHPDLAVSYINLGNCFLAQNRPGSAVSYYRLGLEMRQKLYPPDHPKIGSVYMALGKCSAGQLRTSLALDFFQKALTIFSEKLEPNHPKLLNYYETVGDVLRDRGIHREALGYYEKILKENSGQNFYTKRRWVIEDKIGLCYQHLGDFYDAKTRHEAAIELFEKDFEVTDPGYLELISNLGNAYFRHQDYEKAFEAYEKANKINLKTTGKIDPILSNNLGLCAVENYENEKAIQYFSEAIENSATKFEYPIFYKNLAVAEKQQGDFGEANQVLIFVGEYFTGEKTETLDWLSILIEKADVLRKLKKEAKAEATFEEADILAKKLRNRLMDPIARQQFQAAYYHLYKNMVDFYFEKWESTGEKKYLNGAFEASEKSKSLVLLETVQATNISNYARVPPKILEEEARLISSINNFSNTDSLSASSPQFEFEKFLQKLSEEHSEYFELKYRTEVTNAEDLRKDLTEKQVICEYFITDNSIYVFLLSRKVFDFIKIEKDFLLNDWMLEFRRATDVYARSSGENLKESIFQYNQKAFDLHEKLVAPIFQKHQLPDEWIIVPDGILNYLPFECLLTENRDSSDRFKTHPYLLHKLKISYVYSGSMYHELLKRDLPKASKNLLSVAPTFKNSAFGLNELSFNIPEAEAVAEMFGGDILKNEAATLPQFLAQAADYRILLLATHGEANARAGEYSWLAFTYLNDTLNNDLLYAKDLYENSFAASLIVLSACETGIGEYRQGEGVLSLARGFFYTGAQSIIPTLWSVDDARNSEIIQSFFGHLKGGKKGVDALHAAKMDFLENRTHDEAHPVYWAAPVLIGLPDPDTSIAWSWTIWAMIFGGAVILGLGIFFKLPTETTPPDPQGNALANP